MPDFPTVGLNVDLNTIVRAKAEFSALKAGIADVGDAAEEAAKKAKYLLGVEIQSAKMAAAAGSAATKQRVADSEQAARAQVAAAKASADALAAQNSRYLNIRMANTRAAIATELAADKQAATSAASVLALRIRLAQQEAREINAGQASVTAFRAAMAKQRASEDVAEARAAAAAAAASAREQEAAFRYVHGVKVRYFLAEQAQAEKTAAAEARAAAVAAREQIAAAAAATKAREAFMKRSLADAKAYQATRVAAERAVTEATVEGGAIQTAVHRRVAGVAGKIRESFVLVREGIRGDTTRMAGSLTLLAQYFGLLEPRILAVGAALALTIGPMVALGVAMEQGSRKAAQFQNDLILTGNYAGITADQLEAMAKRVAESSHTNVLSAEEGITQLVASGKFTASTIELMASTAERFSQLSHQSVSDILKGYEDMKGGVVTWAVKHEQAYHDLDLAQIKAIARLEDLGKHEEAVALAMKGVHDHIYSQAAPSFGYLENSVHRVKNELAELWALMQNFGKPETYAHQVNRFATSVREDAARLRNPNLSADAQQQIEDHMHDAQANMHHALQQQQDAVPAAAAASAAAVAEQDKIDKWYADRNKHPHTPSTAGATNSLAALQAQASSLVTQFGSVNADPMSEWASKIAGAGDVAAARRTAGTGAPLQDPARAAAQLKELATLAIQAGEAMAKQTRSQTDHNAVTQVQIATDSTANKIMLDFWASGTKSSAGYAAALEQVHQTQLDAQKAQAMLSVAQTYGVNTTSQIRDHVLAMIAPNREATDTERTLAQGLQDFATKAYLATAAQIDLNDQRERKNALDTHAASVAQEISDLHDHTDAVLAGAAALALYNRELEIRQAIHDNPGLSDAEAAAEVDHRTMATERLRVAQADLTREVLLGSAGREHEAEAAAILAGHLAEAKQSGIALTETDRQRLEVQSQIEASLKGQITDMQQLQIAIQDSIRNAFIETGKLDFSSLKDGLLKAMRKAIYDAFLAKPIDILVNAAVKWEEKALNSLFDSLQNGQNPLASLFGGKGPQSIDDALQQFSASSSGLSGIVGGLGKAASQLASVAGPLAAAFAIDTMIGQGVGMIAGSLGANTQQQKNAQTGGTFGGLLGSIIGLFWGTGTQDAQTQVLLNAGGGMVGSPGGKHATTDTITGVTNIAAGIQQLISQLGELGVNAQGIITGVETHVLGTDYLYQSPTLRTPVGNDPASITAGVTKLLLANAKVQDPQERILVDQLVAANASLEQISTTLQSYLAAQGVVSDVHIALMKYTDPVTAATLALQKQQIERRKTIIGDINSGYFTSAQIAQLAGELPALEQKEIQDALANVATSADGAAHSMQDFADAQKKIIDFATSLTVGALSPLSPQAQLAAANASYMTDLTGARGGSFDALSNIPNTAQTYLEQAQKFFGSGGAYADIFSTVQQSLTEVGTQTVGTGNSQVDAINAAALALQNAINLGSLNIVNAITASNDNFGGHSGSAPQALTQAQVDQIVAAVVAGTAAQGTMTVEAVNALTAAVRASLATQQALAGGLAA